MFDEERAQQEFKQWLGDLRKSDTERDVTVTKRIAESNEECPAKYTFIGTITKKYHVDKEEVPMGPPSDTTSTPLPCCLYPAAVADDGGYAYPSSDLPETLHIHYTFYDPAVPEDSIDQMCVFTLAGDHYYSCPDFAGGTGGISQNNSYGQVINTWIVGRGQGDSSFFQGDNPCLTDLSDGSFSEFAAIEVQPLFNDTYTVSDGSTVTRVSQCRWTGGGHTLDYGQTTSYKWSLDGVAKTSSQSSPVGSYGTLAVA